MSKLAKQGVSAVKWGAFSSIARFGLQIVAQAVLARTLGPEIYGVFGMGLVVLTFANFFAEFGFGWRLVYSKVLTAEDIRFVFTCQILTGSIVAGAMYGAAGLIAAYFHEPRVEEVVQWIAITCLISAATAPSTNLLARDMRFRETGLIQVLSYFVGYVLVGIPLALNQFGVTALVAAWVTQSSVRLIASYALTRHSVRPLFRHHDAKSVLTSGWVVFVTNITNWFLNNIDRMFVGRLLSATSMGLYTVGANLANTPNGLLLSALQPAFLSAGAKLTDPAQLRAAYSRILSAALVLTVPFFATLAALAPSIVAVLYGEKWSDAAPVMAILFLAMPAFIVWGVSTPVLWNTGRSSHESLVQLPILLLAAALFFKYAAAGIIVVSAITAATLGLRGLVMFLWACRAVGLSPRCCWSDLVRGLLFGGICAGLVIGTQIALLSFNSIIVLVVSPLVAGCVCLFAVALRPSLLGVGATAVVARMAPGVGRWLAKKMAK